MENKKITKIPLNRERFLILAAARGYTVRALGRSKVFEYSSKTIERGLKNGEISTTLMEYLCMFFDVDKQYLSGVKTSNKKFYVAARYGNEDVEWPADDFLEEELTVIVRFLEKLNEHAAKITIDAIAIIDDDD